MRKSSAPSQKHKSAFASPFLARNTSSVLSLLQIKEQQNEKTDVVGKNKHDIDVAKVCVKPDVDAGDIVYKVVWGKKTSKKHKTFEGDGVLKVTSDRTGILLDEDGTKLGSSRLQSRDVLESGFRFCVGGKEVEIVEQCSNDNFIIKSKRDNEFPSETQKKAKKPKLTSSFQGPATITGKRAFFSGKSTVTPLVFPQPSDEFKWNKCGSNKEVRDVILDTFLAQALRPHQRDGLLFLYECVMGFRNREYTGAVLADEMGLGKTLQCIALIWTLLKKGPYGMVICKKVLVVVPSSLCANWSNEFIKWLGRERLEPYVVDKSHKASDFNKCNRSVMIISYEMFVRCISDVEETSFDLVVCDEGHKLKNSNIKASQCLSKLSCKRRILLTGTPIQNDLLEYFAIVDLVNPGILGAYAEFRRNYENPILASQKPDCDEEEHEIGSEKAKLLNDLTSMFMLRRTQEILEKYLPSKREFIICCRMSHIQKELYETAIDEWENKENKVLPLQMITLLKKICNFPLLMSGNTGHSLEGKLAGLIPSESNDFKLSGKLAVLEVMIKNLAVERKEKIVLVSYSTRFLSVLSDLCTGLNVQCLRLDGSTPVQKRQQIVDRFNVKSSKELVFLLSAKAGGVGLNLSAASRLVLLDSDWNPASDLQATARVWRDGQRKGVFLYRLLCSGSIDEKIYQRQVSKTGLSDAVKNPENLKDTLKLSEDELKDLFTPNFDSDSLIHDSLQCTCDGNGTCENADEGDPEEDFVNGNLSSNSKGQVQKESINQLKHWQHFKTPVSEELLMDAGLDISAENVKYIFHKTHFN